MELEEVLDTQKVVRCGDRSGKSFTIELEEVLDTQKTAKKLRKTSRISL